MLDRVKTAIRPGIAIWCICILTLNYMKQLNLIELDGVGLGLVISGIAQWIPDRALKRLKESWNGTVSL